MTNQFSGRRSVAADFNRQARKLEQNIEAFNTETGK
jgi:hypothetical protein